MQGVAEWTEVARAIVRVLRDSERTAEIHKVEELTGRGIYRRLAVDAAMHTLLRERPELRSDVVDYAALRRLAPTTLGGAYVRHLDRYGLSADSQAAPTTLIRDPAQAYVVRRFRQTHDIWHALVELGTSGHEEVLLHAFSWGQLRLPVSALVVAFGSVKHLVLEGRWRTLRTGLGRAYRAGRIAKPLLPVWWERCWSEPLVAVRARYRVERLGDLA